MNLTIIGIFFVLTHHPLVPHICVSELGQHSLNGTIFSAIWIKIHNFTFTKIHLKMPSTKWRPFCLRGNEFNKSLTANVRWTMAQDYLNHWQYDECNWTKTVQGMVLAGPIRLSLGLCLRGWAVVPRTHSTNLLWIQRIKISWEYGLLRVTQ